jgi:hypothetical protein
MSNTPITDQLAQLDQQVTDAHERMGRRQTERRAATRRLAAAESEIETYMRGLGGHDPDPAVLEPLRAKTAEIRSRLRAEEVMAAGPSGQRGDMRIVGVDWLDPEAEAAYAGAVDAHKAAVDERDEFRRANVDGLLAERAPAIGAARDRFVAAMAELSAADAELAAAASWLANLGGATGAWSDAQVPRLPLTHDTRAEIRAAAATLAAQPDRALMVPSGVVQTS